MYLFMVVVVVLVVDVALPLLEAQVASPLQVAQVALLAVAEKTIKRRRKPISSFNKQFAREVHRIYGPPVFFSKSGKELRKKLKKKFVCLRTPDLRAFSEFQNSFSFWSYSSLKLEKFRNSSIWCLTSL
jgi:hypothetical protein